MDVCNHTVGQNMEQNNYWDNERVKNIQESEGKEV